MIRIGTVAGKGEHTVDYVSRVVEHGFESFQINFWEKIPAELILSRMSAQLRRVIEPQDAKVSSIGVYGNPLGETEVDQKTRDSWLVAIDHATHFGCDIVSGFAGRVRGKSVPDSIERYKEVFDPILKRAIKRDVRLAFENSPMGGNWETGDYNIAFCPDAWELIFDALPSDSIGLEWEPCHQICQMIDPIPQLRKWVDKVFHIHGKDATVHEDILARQGILGPSYFAHHRTPGFGDSNWSDIITILREHHYQGTIDIEGLHDPVYKDDLEMTGQVRALRYLKEARGGDFVPNPPSFR